MVERVSSKRTRGKAVLPRQVRDCDVHGALDDLHASMAAGGRLPTQPASGHASVVRQKDEGEAQWTTEAPG